MEEAMTNKSDISAELKEVTIIYYGEDSLELLHSVEQLPLLESGRVKIPDSFKMGKSIIAVCNGRIDILNKFGDRIEFNYQQSKAV